MDVRLVSPDKAHPWRLQDPWVGPPEPNSWNWEGSHGSKGWNPMEAHLFHGKIHGFRVRFSLEPSFIDGKRHRTLVYHNFYDLEWPSVWDKPTQPWQWKIIFTNKIVLKIGNVPLRKGNKTLLRNEQSLCVIMEKIDGCRARKITSNGDQK